MKAFEMLPEVRPAWLQVTDHTDDDRVLCGNVQNPLVVLDPGAAFDYNRSNDAESLGDPAIALRQRRPVQDGVVFGGPGNALRTCRVEEVYVVSIMRRDPAGRDAAFDSAANPARPAARPRNFLRFT